MATNAYNLGNSRVTLVRAEEDCLAGDGVQIGKLFGVAIEDGKRDQPVQIAIEGRFNLPRAQNEGSWATGETVYWDNINKVVTKDGADGVHLDIGISMVDPLSPDNLFAVFLTPLPLNEFTPIIKQIQDDIELLKTIVLDLVPAAYGGMQITTPPIDAPNIPTGTGNWMDLTQFEENDIVDRGCVFDILSGTVAIDLNVTGVWQFTFSFAIDHNSSNSDRQFRFRFFNQTDGVPAGNPVPIYIGRNRVGTNWGETFETTIDTSMANKKFVGQIGEADSTISNVKFQALNFDAHFIDRLENLIDPIADVV